MLRVQQCLVLGGALPLQAGVAHVMLRDAKRDRLRQLTSTDLVLVRRTVTRQVYHAVSRVLNRLDTIRDSWSNLLGSSGSFLISLLVCRRIFDRLLLARDMLRLISFSIDHLGDTWRLRVRHWFLFVMRLCLMLDQLDDLLLGVLLCLWIHQLVRVRFDSIVARLVRNFLITDADKRRLDPVLVRFALQVYS